MYYLAVKDGSGYVLAKSEDMDWALEQGFNIHQVNDDDSEVIIATPKDGYLVEPPVFGPIICRLKGANDG